MVERFPSMRGAALDRIVRKLCGDPIRQKGSHRTFQGRNGQFTFAYHDGAEVSGSIVRRVLIVDIGLSPEEARNEVK
jgi:predicted RNA binding protein YcfA (HicA-like mRNA interferase family)